MKAILPLLAAIVCIFVLIAGKLQWNEKTKVTVTNDSAAAETSTASNSSDNTKTFVDPKIYTYTKNWPQQAQDSFKNAMEDGNVYKIAIVGSQVLGDETQGWASQLKGALLDTYGKDHVDVSIYAYDLTSTNFMKKHKEDEIVNANADLILFEPFILNDNGKVTVEDNHKNIQTFINDIQKENTDAVVILQPSNPIPNAVVYPQQVQQLQEFAKSTNIPYIDHWSAWPDPNTDAINPYLDSNSNPNEKGSVLWFEFLKKYFIAE